MCGRIAGSSSRAWVGPVILVSSILVRGVIRLPTTNFGNRSVHSAAAAPLGCSDRRLQRSLDRRIRRDQGGLTERLN